MNNETKANVVRLNLIAAKATQLAHDVEHGKLWPGQLYEGLRDMNEQLALLTRNTTPRD